MTTTPTQEQAALAAFQTATGLSDALRTAAATLQAEYGSASDTVANGVSWLLKAAANELDGNAQTLSEAFCL